MKQSMKICLQYRIKPDLIDQYEQVMTDLSKVLSEYGANQLQWYLTGENENTYIEMFEVPTESHYHAIKRLRTSRKHQFFGKFDYLVVGGMRTINSWAFKNYQVQ